MPHKYCNGLLVFDAFPDVDAFTVTATDSNRNPDTDGIAFSMALCIAGADSRPDAVSDRDPVTGHDRSTGHAIADADSLCPRLVVSTNRAALARNSGGASSRMPRITMPRSGTLFVHVGHLRWRNLLCDRGYALLFPGMFGADRSRV
jgi:hypothetical protein